MLFVAVCLMRPYLRTRTGNSFSEIQRGHPALGTKLQEIQCQRFCLQAQTAAAKLAVQWVEAENHDGKDTQSKYFPDMAGHSRKATHRGEFTADTREDGGKFGAGRKSDGTRSRAGFGRLCESGFHSDGERTLSASHRSQASTWYLLIITALASLPLCCELRAPMYSAKLLM